MFGYIYKTTNLINNKIYIGQHRADHFEPEKYIGSGNLLRRAIDKYGEENFKNEMICECFDQNDMDQKERFYIAEYDATNIDIGYNITDGGFGGSGPRSEETKDKIRDYNTGKTIVNNGTTCLKIDQTELENYINLGYRHGPLPFERSEEFKTKVSLTNSNKIAIRKGDHKTRVNAEELEKYLADGYTIGWVEIKKQYIKQKVEGTGPSKYMHKDDIYKLVPESRQAEYLAEGWVFGAKTGRKVFEHKHGYKLSDETRQKLSDAHRGIKPSSQSIEKRKQSMIGKYGKSKGRTTINKEGSIKIIPKDQLSKYLDDGWKLGRK